MQPPVFEVNLSPNSGCQPPSTPNSGPPSSPLPSTCTVSSTLSRSGEINTPDHWRPVIEQCLADQCLTESACCDMMRTLVNQLFAKSSKPTREQCEQLARKLILKYPFFKDDMGNGYVS